VNNLKGKNAIVTGGGSGIGYAIAQALVAEGVNVLIASRRGELLETAAAALNRAGPGRAVPAVLDIRKKEDIVRVVRLAQKSFPSLDILVNNAGLGVSSAIADCTDEEWDLVIGTNLTGVFRLTRECLPVMMAQRSGYIINIASQAAKHGYPLAGPYCASKFGLLGFTEALQAEVREYGILAHALCPALVQVPPPKTGSEVRPDVLQPEDLASTVLFLLRQPSRIRYENIGLYRL